MHKTIQVDHLCRVEGYGGISVDIEYGKVVKVNLNVLEGARFLESLVVGRRYDEVPEILSRICAICSAVHKLTSVTAIENALGIKVSPQTQLLRDLLIQGENIESHALHIFCLILPDFFKKNSVISLAEDHPEEVLLGLRLKKLGNTLQELIGGRAVHPVNAVIGGFGKYPTLDSIKDIKTQLEKELDGAMKMVALLKTVNLPKYSESPTVYAALKPENGNYSFFGHEIITSRGEVFPVEKYKKLTNEYVVSHSNAKHSRCENKPYMVGSLARLILNGNQLKDKAKMALDILGIPLPTNNIFYNNLAQAVELVYAIERAIEICEILIKKGIKEEKIPKFKIKSGSGTGAIEAPRGTLYHSYTLDENGYITYADVITPTAQNLSNLEKDIRTAATNLIDKPSDELRFNLEMVARAYDPCISCSVHLITLNYKTKTITK